MNRVDAGVPTGGQFDTTPKNEPQVTLGLSVDDGPPEDLTSEHIFNDISFSNELGTSWFVYRADGDTLKADLYTPEGDVDKTFTVALDISRDDQVSGGDEAIDVEGLSVDEDAPDALTFDHFASDLAASNEEGMSWFTYRVADGQLKADLYAAEGGIITGTYTIAATITED